MPGIEDHRLLLEVCLLKYYLSEVVCFYLSENSLFFLVSILGWLLFFSLSMLKTSHCLLAFFLSFLFFFFLLKGNHRSICCSFAISLFLPLVTAHISFSLMLCSFSSVFPSDAECPGRDFLEFILLEIYLDSCIWGQSFRYFHKVLSHYVLKLCLFFILIPSELLIRWIC